MLPLQQCTVCWVRLPPYNSRLRCTRLGGEDRSGHPHTLGFSSLAFKVAADETRGGLFVIGHRNLMPGGPPPHLYPHQEEWFYVMEGTVVFQVGDQRVELRLGESILAPRAMPHTFSAVHDASHLLITFCQAGKMEQYFVDAERHPDQRRRRSSWTATICNGSDLRHSGNRELEPDRGESGSRKHRPAEPRWTQMQSGSCSA